MSFDDDSDLDDWPDSDDEDAESLTVDCSNCGAAVYEDAVRCPVCGEYVAWSASGWSDRPGWFVLLGIAGLIATIIALSGLMAWW
ncbi:MAG: zinc ribbon domain-containing protein [Planctomycetaceae bacterium]